VSKYSGKLAALEALRGAAALYVFLHHAHLMPNQGLGMLLYFGQEAVIIFFILSGFVICYSASRHQMHWPEYLIHRAKRIYPIFLIALVLAYLSQSLVAETWLELEWGSLTGNIFMLQDVSALKRGVWFDTYYGNSPLWSLSYEWWFYVIFIPLGLYGRFAKNKYFIYALILSVSGFLGYQYMPNQLCLYLGYFFIWWAGVELAKEYIKVGALSFKKQRPMLLGLALMTGLWSLPVVIQLAKHIEMQLGTDPILQFRHHLAALIFVVLGITISQRKLQIPSWLMRPFIILAPISYAIYLTHQPLLNIAQKMIGNSSPFISFLLALPSALLLGWLLEVRMQSWINGIIARIYPSSKQVVQESKKIQPI
jgi:peptidoglycan/LPS O-acetylase OafA/YrhL